MKRKAWHGKIKTSTRHAKQEKKQYRIQNNRKTRQENYKALTTQVNTRISTRQDRTRQDNTPQHKTKTDKKSVHITLRATQTTGKTRNKTRQDKNKNKTGKKSVHLHQPVEPNNTKTQDTGPMIFKKKNMIQKKRLFGFDSIRTY
jgi:hypothetical protein